MTASAYDLRTAADLLERIDDMLGPINLGELSKDTATALSRRPALTALVGTLRQAARETAAVNRLATDLAAMDPDKRREHANDDREWADDRPLAFEDGGPW